jgi:hypothetical protein
MRQDAVIAKRDAEGAGAIGDYRKDDEIREPEERGDERCECSDVDQRESNACPVSGRSIRAAPICGCAKKSLLRSRLFPYSSLSSVAERAG